VFAFFLLKEDFLCLPNIRKTQFRDANKKAWQVWFTCQACADVSMLSRTNNIMILRMRLIYYRILHQKTTCKQLVAMASLKSGIFFFARREAGSQQKILMQQIGFAQFYEFEKAICIPRIFCLPNPARACIIPPASGTKIGKPSVCWLTRPGREILVERR
jgi:hypothetical protein